MKARDFAANDPFDVQNQPPPLEDYNLWEFDRPARDALALYCDDNSGAQADTETLSYGARLGRAEVLRLGELANRYEPELRTYDRFGHRIDEVEFHESWHRLMSLSIEAGIHSTPWTSADSGAHVRRAAMSHLKHQVEQGTSCPVTMTFAVVPSLRIQPEIASVWEPRAMSRQYDPRLIPAHQKTGVLFGMAMTERQGGSDVRANTTRARAIGTRGPGNEYLLRGHKWFCSAPMCDAFLVLAQSEGGLSCFLVPRFTPDDERNPFQIQRLKSKLGNRSNASSEIVFDDTWAQMVGEEGRGVATIIEMVRHTRLDCTLGAASLIRRCVAEACHHTAYRYAFGRRLIEQPLMKNVLADLCLESEAATAAGFRLAAAFDAAQHSEDAARFARIATAIAKYQVTKKETDVAREAMECHGGNGYVEEAPIARLFRESPLNSIWEGSGNVQCLDVLRAAQRDPETLSLFVAELDEARGGDARYDGWLDALKDRLSDPSDLELRARRVVEELATGLQASLLVRHAPAAVSDAFVASRLVGERGRAYGTLGRDVDFDAIIERSLPQVG